MIEEEQAKEYSPKETLYIRNVNEKMRPKGTSSATQTSSTPSSTSSSPSDRWSRSCASAARRCAGRPSWCSRKWVRPLRPRTTCTATPSSAGLWYSCPHSAHHLCRRPQQDPQLRLKVIYSHHSYCITASL